MEIRRVLGGVVEKGGMGWSGWVQRWERSAELLRRSFRGLRSVLQQELLT